ncbi:MAG: hypothetical protein DWQ02_13100 [Bacteroidetes bacterium]|nr:MAG: hypothetical protein DWQ02_13100 [Bacteroidota bacterium]
MTSKSKIYLLVFIALFTLANSKAVAQKTSISLEIDPATFIFKGYSAHLRIAPGGTEHLLLGAGVYAMDMPSFLVDLNKNNKGLGWNVRLNMGAGLFGEYHFKEVNRKSFVGLQTSLQEFKIANDSVDDEEKFSNLLLMAYTGYTFKPFDFNLYVKPWAGIGYASKISGETNLGELDYDLAPVTMFLTLHVGYTF